MRWSLFCRVVDNFGDVGFAWRLACDLATRGEPVRLAIDDARALAWMAPHGHAGVTVVGFDDPGTADGDVLVETFGCGWPSGLWSQLERRARLPVLVNVEHLSAERYVERSHGLPSPRYLADGRPLPTWFFYPGFSVATGGLLREPGLLERPAQPGDDRRRLRELDIERLVGERCVSLFCYPNLALDALLDALAAEPTLLLLTPGFAAREASALLGPGLARGRLRAQPLPALAQPEFDALLRACDLNVVRGEDSLVRAVWAGKAFLWQAYVQGDGAHRAKVEALLDRMLATTPAPLAASIRSAFASWNGIGVGAPVAPWALPPWPDWTAAVKAWRDRLAVLPELTGALIAFAASKG